MKAPETLARACALWAALSVVLLVGSSDAGSLSAVKKEDAIKVANKEVEKLGIDLRDLEIEVDKGNRQWDEFMSILRESGEATREQYQRYQSRLKGRTFWTIFYSPKRIDGRRPKGGDATVLIDARSGEVLIVIRGE